jgi:hypothetical protein
MVQQARRCLTLSLLGALVLCGQRVVLVSFDGLGHQTFTTDPVAAELRVLKDAARRGVIAQGLQAAFPSTTANSHAALWTGAYGDVHTVTANNPPLLPRGEHTVTERGNGFFGDMLRADTFWVTAAKAGIKAVAHQPTQGYPFTAHNTAPGAIVVNGYQTKQIAPHVLWTAENAVARQDGSFSLRHGPLSIRATRTASGLRLEANGQTVEVTAAPAETEPPRNRPLARRFSDGLSLDSPAAVIYFRLFSLTPGDFRLYASPWQELGASVPLPTLLRDAGGFAGNGAYLLLTSGRISPQEYLETSELVIRQMTRHAAWLMKQLEPRVFQTYLPFPDEYDHEWLALARAGSATARQYRRWGYIAIDRGAEEFAKLGAGRNDTTLWTSDHGMTPVTKYLNVSNVLAGAQLAQKTAYLYNSILVNTTDWKGGAVTPADRAAVVDAARRALAAVRDPDTGQTVVREFFTPEKDGETYGIGGPAGGDLYFDLAPGYQASGRAGPALIEPLKSPRGVHGFLPSREDMAAILIGRGPRLPKSAKWPRLRSIDVAPLICELLGIAPPPQSRGRAPHGIRSSR